MTVTLDLFAEEEREKRRILAMHKERRKEWLAEVRQRLRQLFDERARVSADAYVTANDAREIYESLPNVPPASEVSRSFLGAVFHHSGWVSCGVDKSHARGHHACMILRWRRAD